MVNINSQESFMLYLINLIGGEFPQSAILKGGMSMRLLDSPRFTNDLDYIFVPFKSKKDIVEDILSLLDSIEELVYSYSLNSKALRIKITYKEFSTQIEANVAESCPSIPISTSSLSLPVNQLGKVVSIMDLSFSMAHKLAAWNERRLIRDLYDIYFYYVNLKVKPDINVLKDRLQNINSTKKNKNPEKMTITEFTNRLAKEAEGLSSRDMKELSDFLPADYSIGLELKLKANLLQLCVELKEYIHK
ncbi:MAG: nucleotidyl transferase AbiEii/AbiGii toxin family protein [Acidobacteriota bacterium]